MVARNMSILDFLKKSKRSASKKSRKSKSPSRRRRSPRKSRRSPSRRRKSRRSPSKLTVVVVKRGRRSRKL